MDSQSIVPEIIDTIPPNIIKITYPSGVAINLGNELTPTSVKDEPKLEWPTEKDTLYTLCFIHCMTDSDSATGDPKFIAVKHWLVINIAGNDLTSGQTLAAYFGSGPPKGTGLHRYVFIVYKQQKRVETDEPFVSNRSTEGRGDFKIKEFALKHKLGEPIAWNHYLAQYDDYVPLLYAQIGLPLSR